MRGLLAALVLVFLSAEALAWDWDAHRYLAEEICRHYSCGCYAEIKDGSVIPDRDFQDFSYHSCYDPESCTPSSYYSCPTWKSCPAMDKAKEWMEKAAKAEGCERWKYVGIASHYFFDAKCVWHQVTNEDYYGCHKPFEDEVGEKVKRYGLSGWTVCKCSVCVSASNFRAWLEEFYAFADSYLQAASAVEINSCTDITQSGEYVLTSNVIGVQGDQSYCIGISASNVTLKGNGHSITGDGWGIGILLGYAENVTIESVSVSNYEVGISLSFSNKTA